jgi:hypothetical protein
MKNVYGITVFEPEGKRQLRRPRCRWEGNIKIDLQEIGNERVDWIHVSEVRDQWRTPVNTVMNYRVS